MEQTQEITAFRGRYKFLSNFAHTPFWAPMNRQNYQFPTVEHYFQANKAYRAEDRLRILQARTPRQAKHLGNNVELVDDWDNHRFFVMAQGLRYKFGIPKYRDLLLATGDAILIEGNTWNDRFWGMVQLHGANGPVWVGENHLGKLLMQVRQELRG